MAFSFFGGIHPQENKHHAEDKRVQDFPAPEVLIIPMEDDEQGFSFNVTMFFTGDLENATLYVWNLINYDPASVYEVAYACNQCNYNSTYMKFYADETDNTVTAERWVIFRDHDVAEIVGEAFGGLLKEIENFYSVLAPYAV